MAEENKKQVVHYRVTPHQYIEVGTSAIVTPVDHPDTIRVTNGQVALTSEVLSYDAETGEFETLNTLYKREQTASTAE